MSACRKELSHVPSSESLRGRISADSGGIFANISKCSSVMACGGGGCLVCTFVALKTSQYT